MKYLGLSISLCLLFVSSNAQLSTPVAHWDMNNSTNDITGNGHNGIGANVLAAAGALGLPNTAYQFNGSNSVIVASGSPAFNMTRYSICVTLNIQGFYSGLCNGNYVVARGMEAGDGNWSLRFDDNAYNDCYTLDTNSQVFIATAGINTPLSTSDWQYTPAIESYKWYKIVLTYDSLDWRLYSNNNILLNTITGLATPIGTNNENVAIGMNIWSNNYPFPFKGVIDDLIIYDRVLTPEEIVVYTNVCGNIVQHPRDTIVNVNGAALYNINTTMINAEYQWQMNDGNGFVDLSNSSAYSGVTTNQITASNVQFLMNSYQYRCIVTNSDGCSDTSGAAKLFIMTDVEKISSKLVPSIYPNPSKEYVQIDVPVSGKRTIVNIYEATGRLVMSETIETNSEKISVRNIPVGVYQIKISVDDIVYIGKLIKM